MAAQTFLFPDSSGERALEKQSKDSLVSSHDDKQVWQGPGSHMTKSLQHPQYYLYYTEEMEVT